VQQLPPRKIAAAHLALVLANLALNCGLGWFLRSDDLQWAILLLAIFLIAIGILLGQTLLLAFWITFLEGRWLWQFVIPAFLSAGLVAACVLSAGVGLEESSLAALFLQVVLWTLVALLMPIRRVRGWRLKRGDGPLPSEHGRFRVSDLLIWTVIIGVPLALVRLLMPLGAQGGITAGLRVIVTLALMLLPLLWLAMLAAFEARGWRHSWLYAAGVATYAIAVTAIATSEFYHLVFDAFWWPRPGWLLLLHSISFSSLFFLVSSLVLWLNCRVLRIFDWQLVWPAWRSSPVRLGTPGQ